MADKGKSSVNRNKFLKRVKGTLKKGIQDLVRDGSIKDLAGKGPKKVRVPNRNLGEPYFHHDGQGINDYVRPGNDQFVTGDKIARPKNGGQGQGNQASQDGEGEDSFTFSLTKDEFLDMFFENCALPDMVKQSLAIVNETVTQRSGFTNDGPPAALNAMRSMRGAKARRSALRSRKVRKLKELQEREAKLVEEIAALASENADVSALEDELQKLRIEIAELQRRIKAVPFIDPIDLKFNNWAEFDVPTTQALVVCLMDVSGSMDEKKKKLAKTFYLLLYLFLQRNYQRIEVEYITYHSQAQIVDEENFFYGLETGGTVTSAGVECALNLIKSKYPTSLWNIYVAHASDGDNWYSDNEVVRSLLVNQLLPMVQYYAYVQVSPYTSKEYAMAQSQDGLLAVFKPLSESYAKVACEIVTSEDNVYPVFLKLFERKA